MIKKAINKISVRYRPPKIEDVPKMKGFLRTAKEMGCSIIMSSDEENLFSDIVERVSLIEEYSDSDLVIVFGGDGTIIKAAREFSLFGTPVLGVNTGTLGYLAELSPEQHDSMDQVVTGNFRIDDRMMLDVSIIRDDTVISPERPALNEAVITNGPVSRLIRYSLFCNGIHVQSCKADGIIIATPTGSTAYSMSAGGPVADPSLECIITTPICPFGLDRRPVIYSGNTCLEISSVSCHENNVYLTVDGSEIFQIRPDDRIKIEKSKTRAGLVRLKHRSFLEVLHEKML